MTISIFRRPIQARTRRPKTTRIHLALEGLEQRTVLSHVTVVPSPPVAVAEVGNQHGGNNGHHDVAGMAKHAERLTISNLAVNNVVLNGNQLVANATISGMVKNHAFSQQVAIPLSLTPPPVVGMSAASVASLAPSAAAVPVSVLHLTLGAIDLSLLGLNVHLGGDCAINSTKPITVDLTAIPTGTTFMGQQGGLLGDVLSGVANLLNGGGGLGGLLTTGPGTLGGLAPTLNQLESGLTQILNSLLHPAIGATGGSTGGGMVTPPPPGSSQVLQLPLGPISLDLLGAYLQTSTICLNVTATKGPGNLLGNLLG